MTIANTKRELDLCVWHAVRNLDTVFRRLLASMPREPGRDDLWAAYATERAKLSEPVEALTKALLSALPLSDELPSRKWGKHCLLALLVLYDELELAELGSLASERASIPLQTEYCAIHDGGERFYMLVDDALSLAVTPPLVLQVLLYCMQAGFCGRIATKTDPEREEYIRRLSLRVDEAADHKHSPQALEASRSRISGVDFPFIYYVAAAVFVGCVWLALGTLARYHECDEFRHCGRWSGGS